MATALTDEPQVENELKVEVSLDQIGETKYKKRKMDEIMYCIVALLNSFGGILKVCLKACESVASSVKTEDDLLRSVEQQISDKVGSIRTSENFAIERGLKEIIFKVRGAAEFITLNYNLFVATGAQILSVRPFERVDKMLQSPQPEDESEVREQFVKRDYCLGERIGTESKCLQFKNLKSERSKRVSLSDRIAIAKTNKFDKIVSAFANCLGGCILYGISDAGVVEGESICENEIDMIIKKVDKTMRKITWLKLGDQPKRGKQWDIVFKPVNDAQGKQIESLFVVVITVSRCAGGVFTEQPESYHVVKNVVQRMDIA